MPLAFMAILSASEFEAVVTQVKMRVEKGLSERGGVAALETAGRDLSHIFAAARQPAKLKGLRGLLEQTTDLLGREIPDDQAMMEKLWDLADFIDYRT
jgi:hypothetical protein